MDKSEREQLLKNIQYSDADWLESASEIFKKDKEFILEAVKLNGLALEYADDNLRKDKEVVLAAVQQNGQALRFASYEKKNDTEVVLAAVRNDALAIVHASEEQKQNPIVRFQESLTKVGGQNMLLASLDELPSSIWSNVLAKGSTNAFYLFYYLSQKPDLFKK